MSKLDELITKYSEILAEQESIPAAPGGPDPAAPMPGADPTMPAVPAPAAPAPEEEKETKTMTDQGYVMAVQDMLELLSINPEDIEESDLDIFEDRVNPKNAYDLHDKLKELIDRYGSPTA